MRILLALCGICVFSGYALANPEESAIASDITALAVPNVVFASKDRGRGKEEACPDFKDTFRVISPGFTSSVEILAWTTGYSLPSGVAAQVVNSVHIDSDQCWSPGVRVGFGVVPDTDNLDFTARYMYYENHPDVESAPFVNNGVSGSFNGGSLQFVESVADIELAKSYISSHVFFRPFCSLRAAFLRQNQRFQLDNISFLNEIYTGTLKLDQHVWAIGPRIGVQTKWLKYAGFGFIANVSASALYGKLSQDIDIPDSFHIVGPLWQTFPNVDISLGVAYEAYTETDFALTLQALWESNYWWGASSLMMFGNTVNTSGVSIGMNIEY